MEKKLRVLHMPQVPCNPFVVEVGSLKEAKLISDTLAIYDEFQYQEHIKPDYSNATFIEKYNEKEGEWQDWYDEETGIENIDEYFEEMRG